MVKNDLAAAIFICVILPYVNRQEGDRTQTGHVLGLPDRQGTAIAPDRDLPTPAFILLRLVTHLSMLLGSEEDTQVL